MAVLIGNIAATLITAIHIAVTNAVLLEDFYPYNPEVHKQIIRMDDGSSRPIVLNPPLHFYGRSYSACWVHNNGVVALNKPPEHYLSDPFPLQNYTFIAPFYGDVDTRGAGTVWFTDPVTKDNETLQRAENDIHDAFTDYEDFSPTYLIVATWDHVGYYRERNDKLNTFQCVIATDGDISFAIFLYNETKWTSPYDPNSPPKHAKVGFNEGDLIASYEMPCSGSTNVTDVSNTSNVGVLGKWIFRIDKEEIISACPNESSQAVCEKDGLCSCLTEDPQHTCQCAENYTLCTKEETTPDPPPDEVGDLQSLTLGTLPACTTTPDPPPDEGTRPGGGPSIAAISLGVLVPVAIIIITVGLTAGAVIYVDKKKREYSPSSHET